MASKNSMEGIFPRMTSIPNTEMGHYEPPQPIIKNHRALLRNNVSANMTPGPGQRIRLNPQGGFVSEARS